MRRALLIASLLSASACAGPLPGSTAMPGPTPAEPSAPAHDASTRGVRLVVIVRHAEKADDSEDPPLTAAGKARAECLAHLLTPAAVTDVLSTDYVRTRDTVAPLAASHGRAVEVLAEADVKAWVKRLSALPAGSVAVVAGHSNTIPDLVRGLSGQEVAIEHDEYDRMFVLALGETGGSLLAMRYCTTGGPVSHMVAPAGPIQGTMAARVP